MAFIQQRRPTAQRNLYSDQDIDVISRPKTTTASDSENDWHVISSASNHSSPILFPSGSESSFRPLSDTESISEIEEEEEGETTFLPFHDGTGTFIVEDVEFFSSDQTTSQDESMSDEEEEDSIEFQSAIQNLNSDNSILDLILQQGTPPSFATNTTVLSDIFKPTVNEEELSIGALSADSDDKMISLLSDEADGGGLSDHTKFTSKLHKNLDRIPVHHPGIPGSSTSAAILSLVWDSIKKLTNHILENDTNTVETLSSLMSEAVLEGCIPFGSHLHMDIESYHPRSLLEGN